MPVAINFGGAGHLFIGGCEWRAVRGLSAVKALSDAEIAAVGFGESFPNDPTAGTWLSASKKQPRDKMRLLACWYQRLKLAASRVFSNGHSADCIPAGGGATFASNVSRRARRARSYGDVQAERRCTAEVAGVAVAFDFADWSTNNYVLGPARSTTATATASSIATTRRG